VCLLDRTESGQKCSVEWKHETAFGLLDINDVSASSY